MKLKHIRSLFIAAAALGLVASACGSSADDSEVASINGRVLTRSGLDDLLPSGNATVAGRVADVVSSWLTTQAVEFEVIDRGEPITEADIESATDFVEVAAANSRTDDPDSLIQGYALSLAVGRWAEAEAADRPDPEPPDYLCSNHILFETEDDAAAGLERYEAGEDFAELAMELSTGPSGPAGGNLGCAGRGQFVPEFEEAAFAAETGAVVGPVETQFGFHLIEIVSVGPATSEFHPDADPAELATLTEQATDSAITAVILELEAAAKANYAASVSVDASIGTFNGDDFSITP